MSTYAVLAQPMEDMLTPNPTKSGTRQGRNPITAKPWPDETKQCISHAISFSVVITPQFAAIDQQATARPVELLYEIHILVAPPKDKAHVSLCGRWRV